MSNTVTDLQEIVLRECAASGSHPWYPVTFVQATGVPREALDACLDQLRLAGLIRLTDWVAQYGQGYALTEHGEDVLHNQRQLTALRAGRAPKVAAPTTAPEQRMTPLARGDAVRAALMEDQKPVVTQWLLYANIGVFLIGLVLASQRQVSINHYLFGAGTREIAAIWHDTGALRTQDVVGQGEWWRLLSCCFVHLGGIHLATNMYALYILGPALERMLGRSRYLFLYLSAGLCGSCTALLLNPEMGLLAGASGAICGILGGVGVWVWLNKQHLPQSMASGLMRSVLINVVLITVISIPGLLPLNVSWEGHLGGGLAGAVMAWPLVFSRFGVGPQRWLGWLGAVLVPLVMLLLLGQRLGSIQSELPGGDRAGGDNKQEEGPLTQEEKGLKDKYWKRLADLDQEVERVQDQYGRVLIRRKRENEPLPEELKKEEKIFALTEKRAQKFYDALSKEDALKTDRAKQEVKSAKNYSFACVQYFNYLDQSTRVNLEEGDFKKIDNQWKKVRAFREKLQTSPVWR